MGARRSGVRIATAGRGGLARSLRSTGSQVAGPQPHLRHSGCRCALLGRRRPVPAERISGQRLRVHGAEPLAVLANPHLCVVAFQIHRLASDRESLLHLAGDQRDIVVEELDLRRRFIQDVACSEDLADFGPSHSRRTRQRRIDRGLATGGSWTNRRDYSRFRQRLRISACASWGVLMVR